MTEVKIESEELYFAETNTDIADKPRQDNHASESKKYVQNILREALVYNIFQFLFNFF